MSKIVSIRGYEVLDSRGNPTVGAVVVTEDGHGEAIVPAGASTGTYEAVELRDNDDGRYGGKGVRAAVEAINDQLQRALVGLDTANQAKIDRRLLEEDGTPNKARFGANAILAISLATARAEAMAQGRELYDYLHKLYAEGEAVLPVPQMNLINGGRHASNGLSIQEYHVLPVGAPSFAEALRMGVEIYHALRDLLQDKGFQVEIADEGGFAPKVEKSEEAFALLVAAIERAGYLPGTDAFLGIDAAASEFYDASKKIYTLDGLELGPVDLAYRYKSWREEFPLISFEDPFSEDDWDAWSEFMSQQGEYAQVVGDDLYATNSTRIQEGIKRGVTNAVLIKPNQVGTLTETLESVRVAREGGQHIIISHRSGESEDTFIADLSVAVGAGQIKTGAPSRSDRTAKYNRLLVIEEQVASGLSHSLQPFLEKYSGS